MSTMAAATDHHFTREDLNALPEDGHRHELIDGAIIMTPAPGFAHQTMVTEIWSLLRRSAAGTDWVPVVAPFDVVLSDSTVVEPDVLVARLGWFSAKDLPEPPVLAVEVRSAATRSLDEVLKREAYRRAGVTSFWLADPRRPAIRVLELSGEEYVERVHLVGMESARLDLPFPVTLVPALLSPYAG